jgi:DNA primase
MVRPRFTSIDASMSCENLTLMESQLQDCRPIRVSRGRCVRAFCPFHSSDHQRSLSVDTESGRFHCFACSAWGYMDWARERWNKNRRNPTTLAAATIKFQRSAPPPPRADLAALLKTYQHQLPGSVGEEYLESRGIPLALAQRYGLGYALPGRWAHPSRDWKSGRVVFPEHDPHGNLLNLYGRAAGPNSMVPKQLRHDHLPGRRGYFNAAILQRAPSVFVSEGSFDGLSFIAAGKEDAVAIFGVDGWRWEWASRVETIVLAFDADTAGQKGWIEIARQGRLRGKRVLILSAEAYGGAKDASEAWMQGVLHVEDR